MLQPEVRSGIQEPGAHRADIRAHCIGDQLAQPARLHHLDVVVQQQQNLPVCLPRRRVVQRRPGERPWHVQHTHARIARQSAQQMQGLRLLAAVIGH